MSDLQAYHDTTPYPFDEKYDNPTRFKCEDCGWEDYEDELKNITKGTGKVACCPFCLSSNVWRV